MMNDIQTEWRIIFDLSSSEEDFVNEKILKKYDVIVYETLNDAIRFIAQIDQRAVMMKRDLKSAFRHV